MNIGDRVQNTMRDREGYICGFEDETMALVDYGRGPEISSVKYLKTLGRAPVGVPFEYASNIARFSQKSTRCRGNVWFIPYDTIQTKSERFGHPATFPIALPEMCIKLSGIPRGAQVLDPFAGIGTTLVAARNLGMNGLGFEISKDYVESARQRLQN